MSTLTKSVIDAAADGQPLNDLIMQHLFGATTQDGGFWADAKNAKISIVADGGIKGENWTWAAYITERMLIKGWCLSLSCDPDGCRAAYTNLYRQFSAASTSVRVAVMRAALLALASEQKTP